MNFFTSASPPSSRLTPTTLKPRASYLLCSACNSGISTRHGPHHVAHTFSRTTFPFSAETSKDFPSRSFAVYAGMISPASARGCSRAAAGDFAAGAEFEAVDTGRSRLQATSAANTRIAAALLFCRFLGLLATRNDLRLQRCRTFRRNCFRRGGDRQLFRSRVCHTDDYAIGIVEDLNALRRLELRDAEVLMHAEVGDVDIDLVGNGVGQTLDMNV